MTSPFDRYNYTELQQVCAMAGILVRPNEAAEEMIAYIEGTKEPPEYTEGDHAIHIWRSAIAAFLTEQWRNIETQITCPAKALKDPINPNPRPCFGCTDTQVIACLTENRQNESMIAKHRIVRRSH